MNLLAANILDVLMGLFTVDKLEKGKDVCLIGGNSIVRQAPLDDQILEEGVKICVGLFQIQVRWVYKRKKKRPEV